LEHAVEVPGIYDRLLTDPFQDDEMATVESAGKDGRVTWQAARSRLLR
jgi:hypothetical protein